MMEDQIDYQEHSSGQTVGIFISAKNVMNVTQYSLLRLDVWKNGENTGHDLEYRMLEPEGDSKLSANIRKFEILKENIISFYPKLKNCTIRTDFGKRGSLESPLLECKYTTPNSMIS